MSTQIANGVKGGQTTEVHPPSNLTNNAQLRELIERVQALEQALKDTQDQTRNWYVVLQDLQNSRFDPSALEELEKVLTNRINDFVQAMSNKFADKVETKKALKLLERQLKNLYDLIMSKQNGPQDEDAMFNKKHLCGYSCASCEKDLTNLYGKKVEFLSWGKMPFRDPSERIARVGQGFSKMLSMINPD